VDPFHIGVVPVSAMDSRKRLLASLEEVFPIVFDGRQPRDLGGLDGMLVLDPAHLDEMPAGVRVLVTASSPGPPARSELVQFTCNEHVDRPLKGHALIEDRAHGRSAFPFMGGDSVLATVDERPVWWCRGNADPRVDISVFSPEELHEGETLRDHLRTGRFMGLVPLLHFLRDVCGELNLSEQPLLASFVIDDPNLHWPSYGFLKYADLIRHASTHRYHVGVAMVPLDGWLVNRRAASLVRANSAFLSLLVHGNDHVARELGRLSTDRNAEPAIGQALKRVASFERRSGVAVRRVMVPPHGACSEAALRAMFRLGFEAACMSRPYPWRDRLPPPSPLVGWHPAEMVAGGFPILPRYHIDHPREELVFRALLRQPLILYGHHWDLAQGLEVLAQAADDVNRLGDVRWGPLDWIARRNYSTHAQVELSLPPDRPLEPHALPNLATKPWPIARRMLVEGRDRMHPLFRTRPRRRDGDGARPRTGAARAS
jgi:hypothetical protein